MLRFKRSLNFYLALVTVALLMPILLFVIQEQQRAVAELPLVLPPDRDPRITAARKRATMISVPTWNGGRAYIPSGRYVRPAPPPAATIPSAGRLAPPAKLHSQNLTSSDWELSLEPCSTGAKMDTAVVTVIFQGLSWSGTGRCSFRVNGPATGQSWGRGTRGVSIRQQAGYGKIITQMVSGANGATSHFKSAYALGINTVTMNQHLLRFEDQGTKLRIGKRVFDLRPGKLMIRVSPAGAATVQLPSIR